MKRILIATLIVFALLAVSSVAPYLPESVAWAYGSAGNGGEGDGSDEANDNDPGDGGGGDGGGGDCGDVSGE